jgi:DNA polymerase III subunit delta'
MPILPLYGHHALRDRLRHAFEGGVLPASLLIHGPAGVGKQRLALWIGQLLLCQGEGTPPCGCCRSCRYAGDLVHPDLHWFFPRPRLKDTDAGSDDVLADLTDGLTERLMTGGVYDRPSGSEGIFVATVRTLVRQSAFKPTLGARKVFVVGEAERMVPQEGSEMAANAFLKLLEEPPADTTIIITSSESGALLPTIRSRVVSLRAAPLDAESMRAFADDPAVVSKIGPSSTQKLRSAGGSPGSLIEASARDDATAAAHRFLEGALGSRPDRMQMVLGLGGSRARGFFSDMLDALTLLLQDRARAAARSGEGRQALAAARAVEVVEEAKWRASGNVNPQLIGAAVAREIREMGIERHPGS